MPSIGLEVLIRSYSKYFFVRIFWSSLPVHARNTTPLSSCKSFDWNSICVKESLQWSRTFWNSGSLPLHVPNTTPLCDCKSFEWNPICVTESSVKQNILELASPSTEILSVSHSVKWSRTQSNCQTAYIYRKSQSSQNRQVFVWHLSVSVLSEAEHSGTSFQCMLKTQRFFPLASLSTEILSVSQIFKWSRTQSNWHTVYFNV